MAAKSQKVKSVSGKNAYGTIPAVAARADPKKLTKEESRFVVGVIRKMDPIEVCRSLGFKDPELTAFDILGRPHVQAALSARAMRHVMGSLLPSALLAHQEVLDDKTAPPAARMAAVRAVYELTHLADQSVIDATPADNRPLSEYSPSELRDLINRGNKALEQLDAQMVTINGGNPPPVIDQDAQD